MLSAVGQGPDRAEVGCGPDRPVLQRAPIDGEGTVSDVGEIELDVPDEDELDLDDVEPDEAEFEESLEELEAAELDEDFGDDGPAVLDPEPAGDPDEVVTAVDLDAEDADAEDGDDVSDAPDVSVDEDDEDDGDEGLREGEFICASCYLAKGPTQLADAKRSLCVDCV